MKSIHLLLFLFISFGLYAQSKKEVNLQLKADLNVAKQSYDSILNSRSFYKTQSRYFNSELRENWTSLVYFKEREDNLRKSIKEMHEFLYTLKFDPNSLINLDSIQKISAPTYDLKPTEFNERFQAIQPNVSVEALESIEHLKIKEQNLLLKTKITSYQNANLANRQQLKSDIQLLNDLTNKRDELIPIKIEYQEKIIRLQKAFNDLDNKRVEILIKQEEAEQLRLEREEEAREKANAKKKGKEKTVKFVPPVIVDKEYEEEIPEVVKDTRSYKTNEEYGYFDVEPEVERAPSPPQPEIYDIVEEEAEFPGGREAMNEYLKLNLRIPQIAIELNISARCYLMFVVSESGNISNVKVKRGVADCPECDAEAVRLVKSMPNWIPGKNNGKAVNTWYTLPIKFETK